jgi:hypothetical protein
MASEIVTAIVRLLDKGLEAWVAFIETRQEAYNRHMDKRQEKAIHLSEQSFSIMNDIFMIIYEEATMSTKARKQYNKLKARLLALKKKFDVYD